MREDTLSEYGVDTMDVVMIMGDYYLVRDGYSLISGNHELNQADGSFHLRAISGVALSCVILAFCFGFMMYAILDIIKHLKISNIISKKTIRLQRQLFVTLCLQTIIPLIFLYCPCGVMIYSKVNSQWMARATPLLISFFLPLDSLAVLLSMTEYRRKVFKLVQCSCFSSLYHTVSLASRERHSSTVHRSVIP
ncbi:hypothetical protein PRIPAC_82810 [Pristionchus pacificus]|uniref:G protein-coupled receptor n=1 Tax=Pristionchus pacificus TaxID=54126 RepID=A0A2A6C2Z5_PRIPA|nr:hypothetical protein PRIPAC_82810 [Pristionchus pacificus]|eukprot:PDM72602.1 G protein-coupled receptor [Pristionchus pacificus]